MGHLTDKQFHLLLNRTACRHQTNQHENTDTQQPQKQTALAQHHQSPPRYVFQCLDSFWTQIDRVARDVGHRNGPFRRLIFSHHLQAAVNQLFRVQLVGQLGGFRPDLHQCIVILQLDGPSHKRDPPTGQNDEAKQRTSKQKVLASSTLGSV